MKHTAIGTTDFLFLLQREFNGLKSWQRKIFLRL